MGGKMNKLDKEQFKFLLEHNIIKVGSFVTIANQKMDSTDFKITDINEAEDSYHINVIMVDKPGVRYKITHNSIRNIDDMDISRVMQAYAVDDELSIIEINDESDVTNDIVGVVGYVFKTSDGNIIELEDGMKFIFHNDVNPKYKNKVLTVKGVGESIKLVAPRGRPRKNT